MTRWADVQQALRASWDEQTADDAATWSPDRPAHMQCLVSVLVAHDHCGGDLLEAPVLREGRFAEAHYWLRLPSGTEVDPTREQFDGSVRLGPVRTVPRPHPVPSPWRDRYELLAQRVAQRLVADERRLEVDLATTTDVDTLTLTENGRTVAVVTVQDGPGGVELRLPSRDLPAHGTMRGDLVAAAELALARRAARAGVVGARAVCRAGGDAAAMLVEAGWERGADGVLRKQLPGPR